MSLRAVPTEAVFQTRVMFPDISLTTNPCVSNESYLIRGSDTDTGICNTHAGIGIGRRQLAAGGACHDVLLVRDTAELIAGGKPVALYGLADGLGHPDSLAFARAFMEKIQACIPRDVARSGSNPAEILNRVGRSVVADLYADPKFSSLIGTRDKNLGPFGAAVLVFVVNQYGEGAFWSVGDISLYKLGNKGPELLNKLHNSPKSIHGLTTFVGMQSKNIAALSVSAGSFKLARGESLFAIDDVIHATRDRLGHELVLDVKKVLRQISSIRRSDEIDAAILRLIVAELATQNVPSDDIVYALVTPK